MIPLLPQWDGPFGVSLTTQRFNKKFTMKSILYLVNFCIYSQNEIRLKAKNHQIFAGQSARSCTSEDLKQLKYLEKVIKVVFKKLFL